MDSDDDLVKVKIAKISKEASILVACATLLGVIIGALFSFGGEYVKARLSGNSSMEKDLQDKVFRVLSNNSLSVDQKQLQLNVLLNVHNAVLDGTKKDSLPAVINDLFYNCFEWHGYVFETGTHNPISGARLIFNSELENHGSQVVFSDQDGYFEFYQYVYDGEEIEEINYTLVVSKYGYEAAPREKHKIKRGVKFFHDMYLTNENI